MSVTCPHAGLAKPKVFQQALSRKTKKGSPPPTGYLCCICGKNASDKGHLTEKHPVAYNYDDQSLWCFTCGCLTNHSEADISELIDLLEHKGLVVLSTPPPQPTPNHEAEVGISDSATDSEEKGLKKMASAVELQGGGHEVVETSGGFESIRSAYENLGSDAYYSAHGSSYTNPHEESLTRALHSALGSWEGIVLQSPGLLRGLDFACGSGEASTAFLQWHGAKKCELEASDPFCYEAYEKRMNLPCYKWSFQDVAGGILHEVEPYDIVLSSFALHLIEPQWKHITLSALARSTRFLVVLTPHKRPVVEESTGFLQRGEIVHERVRVRLYESRTCRQRTKIDTTSNC